jgi:hypothetical protein
MRQRVVVITGAIALGCGGMFWNKWKLEERDVNGTATALVPGTLKPGHRVETPDWIAQHFDQIHTWPMGSGTPYQTRFVVQLLASELSEAHARRPAYEGTGALEQCTQVRWLDHESGECRHQVNMLDEP